MDDIKNIKLNKTEEYIVEINNKIALKESQIKTYLKDYNACSVKSHEAEYYANKLAISYGILNSLIQVRITLIALNSES